MKLFGKAKTVVGITEAELNELYNTIRAEYEKTQANHKKPTEYMRGLEFAMDALVNVVAHEL